MKCPACDKPAKIPENSEINADTYGRSLLVRTDCCGRLVHLYPTRSYKLETYDGSRITDDWGRPVNKMKGAA